MSELPAHNAGEERPEAMNETPTPRTDAAIVYRDIDWQSIAPEFARQLERELAQVRAELERLKLAHNPLCDSLGKNPDGIIKPCNCYTKLSLENAQLRAELAHENAAKVTPALVMDYAKIQRERDHLRTELAEANAKLKAADIEYQRLIVRLGEYIGHQKTAELIRARLATTNVKP